MTKNLHYNILHIYISITSQKIPLETTTSQYNKEHQKMTFWTICRKYFGYSTSLLSHKKEIHFNIKEHKCEQCSKSFAVKSYVHRHVNRIHEKTDRFKCDKCFKSFWLQKNYR